MTKNLGEKADANLAIITDDSNPAKEANSSAPKQTASSIWVEISKHPLLILLIGTLIGSIIIPQLDRRLSRSRQEDQLRTERAIAFMKASNNSERALYVLMTAFGNHYKDDLTEDAWNRPAFRTKIYNLYESFDRSAWRWCSEFVQEAFLLRLITRPEGGRALEACVTYERSLKSTMRVIDPVWGYSFGKASPS